MVIGAIAKGHRVAAIAQKRVDNGRQESAYRGQIDGANGRCAERGGIHPVEEQ